MKKFIIAIAAFACTSGIIFSQTADEIVSNYLKNSGGLEKLKSLKSRKLSGVLPTPQGELNFTLYEKEPNLMLTEIVFQDMRIVPQAFDGEVAWTINPMSGDAAQKLPDDIVKTLKEEAVFEDPFIDYAKKGHEISYQGKETVNGTECYKINLIKNKNNDAEDVSETYYFDSEYYMPILIKSNVGGNDLETYLSNYSEINGFTMPMTIEVKSGGQNQTINIQKIEINPALEDDFFKFKP